MRPSALRWACLAAIDVRRRWSWEPEITGPRKGPVQKDLVHAAPLEIAQQPVQPSLQAINIDVVPKTRLAADTFNAGLLDVDLPGMKVKNTGFRFAGIDPAYHPAR